MKTLFTLFAVALSLATYAGRLGAYKVQVDHNNNIYVLGRFDGRLKVGSAVFGDTASQPFDPIDVHHFLARFSSAGELVWFKDLGNGINSGCWGFCPNTVDMA